MTIKDSTIEKVRNVCLTDILDAEQIQFKRIGREAVTLCPWHNDSSPSLTINDDKGICFCFACGGGSDGIAYVQQKFGLSFADAVIRIADKNGIQVEHDNLDPEEALRIAAQRRRAIEAVQSDHQRFRSSIRSTDGANARSWLIERGITAETSRYFELGLARSGYFGTTTHSENDLRVETQTPRVTIPVHDHRGTLVGFSARRIGRDNLPQKYKNSASSSVFDKGSLIFNEHRAAQEARLAGYLVFVEGHFDVISMWQYGIKNVVAMQGTAAPSVESIKRLMRHCRRFILAYDGDQGGQKAVEQFVGVAGPLACNGELTLSVAQIPEGLDPDECIRNGIDLYAILESAPQWLDWQIDCWLAGLDRSDTHRFSAVEKAIRELIESIKSPALRQYYMDKAAKILTTDSKAAAKLAQSWNKTLPKSKPLGKWQKPDIQWTRHQSERRAIRSYIHFPRTRSRLKSSLKSLQTPSLAWLWNRLNELEELCPEFTPSMVMAVLSVCEPQHLRILRPLAVPTITMVDDDGILDYVEQKLSQNVELHS